MSSQVRYVLTVRYVITSTLCPHKYVMSSQVRYVISLVVPHHREHNVLFCVTGYLYLGEIFRILRLLKLAKSVAGLRVMLLTLRASLKEIALLLFLMTVGTYDYACVVGKYEIRNTKYLLHIFISRDQMHSNKP